MEDAESSSFLRNRKLGSSLNASSEPIEKGTPKEVGQGPSADDYVDEDSWVSKLISCVRVVACFITMMATTLIWSFILLLLLPWPYERIRQGNVCGRVTSRLMLWILGNPIKIEGAEFSKMRAIFICNHASPLDIFLMMTMVPTGTVGIAKKEVIWYPLFGQVYALANHLRIDRSNPTAAIESLNEAAQEAVRKKLSLNIFPEGTRSTDGRLLPFKKGFVHLALQTGLPIVPVVLVGTHRAWKKHSLHVQPTPITLKYLPPISTDGWTAENIDEYVKMMHDLFVQHLPESQRPLPLDQSTNGEMSKLSAPYVIVCLFTLLIWRE